MSAYGPGASSKVVICPPPEIRNIIDRTALFTARNGPHFEERIRENEKGNVKFCFLNTSDPYYPYYELRVNEIKEGKDVSERVLEPVEASEEQRGFVNEESNIEEPMPFEFELHIPTISAKDLEIIKLTAQFTARCGGGFSMTILNNEHQNRQFDFLNPNHSLYPLFNTFVNYYSKIMTPPRHVLDKISMQINNKYDILNFLMVRVRYNQFQEKQSKENEAEIDREKLAYASVNWHDFVVIGTVEFVEADEGLDLAPPLSLEILKVMPLAEKKSAFTFNPNMQELAAPDEDADIEIDDGSD